MLEKLKNWWENIPSYLSFFKHKNSIPEISQSKIALTELPPEMYQKLIDAVAKLPHNPADCQTIISSIDERFEKWRDDPNYANNSVLILSSPVTPVSSVLSQAMGEWAEKKRIPIKILPFTARPNKVSFTGSQSEVTTIKSKLEHYLESRTTKDFANHRQEAIIIPNLSWCFLRSLEGLAGIEYLQTLLGKNPQNRFWIVGINQVGWEYLNLVCHLQAYFEEVVTLSKIEQEDLQKWLEPIIEKLEISFDSSSIEQQVLEEDTSDKEYYFNRLHSISQGNSTIAIQNFIQSIRYQEFKKDEDPEETELKLIAQDPKSPNLPSLETDEQYLLYSLLLHGDLTMPALAQSLGDEESQVQAKIQILRRKGLVEKTDRILKINPIYYPSLKQYLESNNFLITQS